MKTIPVILLLLTAIISFQCRRYPDAYDLSTRFVVLTNYDNQADFSAYHSYVIPPYVGLISTTATDSILDPLYGDSILASVKSHLTACGYTEAPNNGTADLGIVVTVFKEIALSSGWYPGSWWGYPGWGGCYWFHCGSYPGYPPYYPEYAQSTGTLIIEIVDIKNILPPERKLQVIWTNWNGGALGSGVDNLDNALYAIDQAFLQSPYITAQ
jgi:hypothetical protein